MTSNTSRPIDKLTFADMLKSAKSPEVRAEIEAMKNAKLSPEKRAELNDFLKRMGGEDYFR